MSALPSIVLQKLIFSTVVLTDGQRESRMNPQLTAMCQMFLFPASVLVTGIGIARTGWLKVGISLIGTIQGAVWIYRVNVWPDLSQPDWITAMVLASVFFLGAVGSLIIQFVDWQRSATISSIAK
jgi:hypothetical protein